MWLKKKFLNHLKEIILLSHTHNVSPTIVSRKSTGNISSNEACEWHINVRFCSRAIAVALYTEKFEKHISHLNRAIETTISFPSKKVNKRTSGRKKPVSLHPHIYKLHQTICILQKAYILNAHRQISKKQRLEKYCSYDTACQFSVL